MHNVSGEMGLECIESMARQFYGYGCWNAPYWFLGPEPGMAKKDMARKADDLEKRCAAWQRLGGGELLDCIEHHRAFGLLRWHAAPSELQRTWKRLMLVLFGFKGKIQSPEALKRYQATEWGTARGETCAIEMSSLAAHDRSVKRDRRTFRDERIDFIRCMIRQYQPTFILMYGTGQWKRIAEASFDTEGVCPIGQTVAMVTLYPTAPIRANTDEKWLEFGRRLRRRCETRGRS